MKFITSCTFMWETYWSISKAILISYRKNYNLREFHICFEFQVNEPTYISIPIERQREDTFVAVSDIVSF